MCREAVITSRPSHHRSRPSGSQAKVAIFDGVVATLQKLRQVQPQGGTSFAIAASHAASKYTEEVQKYTSSAWNVVRTTYVNFDTDGGNNSGPCYSAIGELRKRADVVGGFVTGVGSWVDQACASRVAKILGVRAS